MAVGTVQSVQLYGAFLEFEDGTSGLLHVSQISHDRVSNVGDVLSIGDKIKVRPALDSHRSLDLSNAASDTRPPMFWLTNFQPTPTVKVLPDIQAAMKRTSASRRILASWPICGIKIRDFIHGAGDGADPGHCKGSSQSLYPQARANSW